MTEEKKKELHRKLKLYGVIPKADEALKSPQTTTEMQSPKDLMHTYHTLKKSEN